MKCKINDENLSLCIFLLEEVIDLNKKHKKIYSKMLENKQQWLQMGNSVPDQNVVCYDRFNDLYKFYSEQVSYYKDYKKSIKSIKIIHINDIKKFNLNIKQMIKHLKEEVKNG